MKTKRTRIDWESMKVTFVEADKENPNPRNPYSHMTPAQREKEIISLSAKIWSRHCMEKVEKMEAEKANL